MLQERTRLQICPPLSSTVNLNGICIAHLVLLGSNKIIQHCTIETR